MQEKGICDRHRERFSELLGVMLEVLSRRELYELHLLAGCILVSPLFALRRQISITT